MFDILAYRAPGFAEGGPYRSRSRWGTPHVPSDIAYPCVWIPRAPQAYGVGLAIVVEKLVRVEVRRVSEQARLDGGAAMPY